MATMGIERREAPPHLSATSEFARTTIGFQCASGNRSFFSTFIVRPNMGTA